MTDEQRAAEQRADEQRADEQRKNIKALLAEQGGDMNDYLRIMSDFRKYGVSQREFTQEELTQILQELRKKILEGKDLKEESTQRATEHLEYHIAMGQRIRVFEVYDKRSNTKVTCLYIPGKGLSLEEKGYNKKVVMQFVDEELAAMQVTAQKRKEAPSRNGSKPGAEGNGTETDTNGITGKENGPGIVRKPRVSEIFTQSIIDMLNSDKEGLALACFEQFANIGMLKATRITSPNVLRRIALKENDLDLTDIIDAFELNKNLRPVMFESPRALYADLVKIYARKFAKKLTGIKQYDQELINKFSFENFHSENDAPAVLAWLEDYADKQSSTKSKEGEGEDISVYLMMLREYAKENTLELIQKIKNADKEWQFDPISTRAKAYSFINFWIATLKRQKMAFMHPWVRKNIIPLLQTRDKRLAYELEGLEEKLGRVLEERPVENLAQILLTKHAVNAPDKISEAVVGHIFYGLWGAGLMYTSDAKKKLEAAEIGFDYDSITKHVLIKYKDLKKTVDDVLERTGFEGIELNSYKELPKLSRQIIKSMIHEEIELCFCYLEDIDKPEPRKRTLKEESNRRDKIMLLYISLEPERYRIKNEKSA